MLSSFLSSLRSGMAKKSLPVVIVLGATGTGKSKLAVALADRFAGEVINADAMQVYEGLDILTNKIPEEERMGCPHHLLGFLDPLKRFSVIDFRDRCLPLVDDLLQRGKLPVIVGGTHYYIESVLWQVLISEPTSSETLVFDSFGQRGNLDPALKSGAGVVSDDLIEGYRGCDLADPEVLFAGTESAVLHDLLKKIDPSAADVLHSNDKRKIMRSIQVYAQYGKRHSELLQNQKAAEGGSNLGGPLRYPKAAILWLQCDQTVLNERLADRVDSMVAAGLVEELLNFHRKIPKDRDIDYSKGIFQSIGLKALHDFLVRDPAAETSDVLLEEGLQNMKQKTIRYAKKQTGWITNRFLKRAGRQLPPVFAFSATDLDQWDQVEEMATEVIDDIIHDRTPRVTPVQQVDVEPDIKSTFLCTICKRSFVLKSQWRDQFLGGGLVYVSAGIAAVNFSHKIFGPSEGSSFVFELFLSFA